MTSRKVRLYIPYSPPGRVSASKTAAPAGYINTYWKLGAGQRQHRHSRHGFGAFDGWTRVGERHGLRRGQVFYGASRVFAVTPSAAATAAQPSYRTMSQASHTSVKYWGKPQEDVIGRSVTAVVRAMSGRVHGDRRTTTRSRGSL